MRLQSTVDSTPNPLLQPWDSPYGLPPFGQVNSAHFVPAFDLALVQHTNDIDAIVASTEPPTFDNTLAELDVSGRLLDRITLLFHNLTASETSPELQKVQLEMAPRLAQHESSVFVPAGLFARIDALHEKRHTLPLDAEQLRLLERVHLDFVRAGARLRDQERLRYGEIMSELATLFTRFSQNLLAEEASYTLELKTEADRAGLPGFVLQAAKAAAQQRGLGDGAYAITLSPSLAEPFLTFSSRRDLRETVWRARVGRGANAGAHDNRPVAAQIMALRQEQAALHGYKTYADYELVDPVSKEITGTLSARDIWDKMILGA